MHGTLETHIGYGDAIVEVSWVATQDSDEGSTWWDIDWDAVLVKFNGMPINPILDKPQWDKIEEAIMNQLPNDLPRAYRPL